MEDIFIKSIQINKLRNLENINIPISETERKHLILTGKNGSGKTSILLEIKQALKLIETKEFISYLGIKFTIQHGLDEITELKKQISIVESKIVAKFEKGLDQKLKELKSYEYTLMRVINNTQSKLNSYPLFVDFNSNSIQDEYYAGNLILAYFEAKRKLEIKIPKGINKVEIKEKYGLEESVGKDFLQHIVNLKADRLFARDEKDEKVVNQIDKWFDNFENSLKGIFDDVDLKLEFNRKTYSFSIINTNDVSSDFTTLSDGYSAILNIISELIMRMESKASKSYDIQGIVLIDEIETHLHIDLQKKILPFLTNFFPKIQFIVTTHSPFVLNSIENAVIFDLEKKVLIEDMTGYSINSIVESYFDSDNYSTVVKEKIIEYENLLNKEDLNEAEEEKLFDLKRYFKDLPKMFSPELALKINQLTLANLSLK